MDTHLIIKKYVVSLFVDFTEIGTEGFWAPVLPLNHSLDESDEKNVWNENLEVWWLPININ